MSETWPVITQDVVKVVEERAKVWESYNEAQAKVAELNKLGSQLAQITPTNVAEFLSEEKTPPAEVNAAVSNIQTEFQRISDNEEKIRKAQSEIEAIKARRTLIISLIVIAIIIVVILIAVGVAKLISAVSFIPPLNWLTTGFSVLWMRCL